MIESLTDTSGRTSKGPQNRDARASISGRNAHQWPSGVGHSSFYLGRTPRFRPLGGPRDGVQVVALAEPVAPEGGRALIDGD